MQDIIKREISFSVYSKQDPVKVMQVNDETGVLIIFYWPQNKLFILIS